MRANFAEPHIALNFPAIELTVEFRALLLNFRLGLLFEFLGADRRFAPRDFDQFRGLFVRRAPGVPGERPNDREADGPSDHDKRHRERPVVKRVALGDQKREVGCAC